MDNLVNMEERVEGEGGGVLGVERGRRGGCVQPRVVCAG